MGLCRIENGYPIVPWWISPKMITSIQLKVDFVRNEKRSLVTVETASSGESGKRERREGTAGIFAYLHGAGRCRCRENVADFSKMVF